MNLDWITKLFTILKSPTKLFSVLFIAISAILITPQDWIPKVPLDVISEKYGDYLSLAWFISFAYLIVMFLLWISRISKKKWNDVSSNHKIQGILSKLPEDGKAVLREFYLDNKITVKLPVEDEIVYYFIDNNIIEVCNEVRCDMTLGWICNCKLTKQTIDFITYEHINLPKESTDQDKQRILNSRPKWVKHIL